MYSIHRWFWNDVYGILLSCKKCTFINCGPENFLFLNLLVLILSNTAYMIGASWSDHLQNLSYWFYYILTNKTTYCSSIMWFCGEENCLKRPYKSVVKSKLQGETKYDKKTLSWNQPPSPYQTISILYKSTVYISTRSSLTHSLKNMISHTPVDSRARSRISCYSYPPLILCG